MHACVPWIQPGCSQSLMASCWTGWWHMVRVVLSQLQRGRDRLGQECSHSCNLAILVYNSRSMLMHNPCTTVSKAVLVGQWLVCTRMGCKPQGFPCQWCWYALRLAWSWLPHKILCNPSWNSQQGLAGVPMHAECSGCLGSGVS